MAKFGTVAKFATTENGKKLINQMEDYARQYASEKFDGVKLSYDTAYSLNDKAIKINETFASELARRSKYGFVSCIVNDLILIVLWGIPIIQGNLLLLAMLINPIMNLINDTYGVINWTKMQRKQKTE